VIQRILIVVAVCGLMSAVRSFIPEGSHVHVSSGALAFGFVLLVAFFSGRIFKAMHLPRLTGYLAAGMVVGPSALGLLTEGMVADLKLFNGVAIALIALTAGTEMDLRTMRPLFPTIFRITGVAVVGTVFLLSATIFLLRPQLPFLADMGVVQAGAVALVLGVTTAAQAPAVVVALRDEMDAEGPMSRVVLGVVVLADLVIIVLFATSSSIAKAVLGGDADVLRTARELSWELFGSLLVGVVVGVILAMYLRRVKSNAALFILTICFVVAEVGSRVHLDPLLVALGAGMFVQNVTEAGHRLAHEIEGASLPVFVVFFAVAGAGIHLDVLPLVWLPAAAIILVRATGFLVGTRLAVRGPGADPVVARWAGFGLLPQAGLALALAMLFTRTFPTFGEGAAALTLGVVAVNELIAPVLFRWALVRSGEAGKRKAHDVSLEGIGELGDPAHTPAATAGH
jgi:Kef-type K+ transport system membrane component KefB